MLVKLSALKHITELKTDIPILRRDTLEDLLYLCLVNHRYAITGYEDPSIGFKYLKDKLMVSIEDYDTELDVVGKLQCGLTFLEFMNKYCRIYYDHDVVGRNTIGEIYFNINK